jgi:hypothetical protein
MSSRTTLRVVKTDVGHGHVSFLILGNVCYVYSPGSPGMTGSVAVGCPRGAAARGDGPACNEGRGVAACCPLGDVVGGVVVGVFCLPTEGYTQGGKF